MKGNANSYMNYGSMQREAQRRVYEMQRRARDAVSGVQTQRNFGQQTNTVYPPQYSQQNRRYEPSAVVPPPPSPPPEQFKPIAERCTEDKSYHCDESHIRAEKPQNSDFLSGLLDDPERVLLLVIILLLLNSAADPMLLLALIYIL